MRVMFITAAILAISLCVGAQERPPNAPPSATLKGTTAISKLDSQKETGDTTQHGAQGSPPTLLYQFINPCPVEQPNTKSKEEQAKADSLDRLYRRYMWATILGVLVALGGVGALIYQTIVTRNSSQRQLRAYVVLEIGSITNIANPIQVFRGEVILPTGAEITNPAVGPVVFIRIKNTGQTPAFRVKHWGNICFREYPLVSELPPATAVDSIPFSVLGQDIISTKKRYLDNRLTAAQIAELRAATAAIYVYGEIHYIDAFKVQRITKYRFTHNQHTGPVGVTTDLTFADEGNEAT